MGGAREKYISTKPDRQKTRFLKQPQNSIGFFSALSHMPLCPLNVDMGTSGF